MTDILLSQSFALEDVPQVPVAVLADDLDSVAVGIDIASDRSGNLVVEAGPAAMALEFVVRLVQRGVATSADKCAGIFQVGVFAGKGSLGAFVEDNASLLRRQFVVGFSQDCVPGGGRETEVSGRSLSARCRQRFPWQDFHFGVHAGADVELGVVEFGADSDVAFDAVDFRADKDQRAIDLN